MFERATHSCKHFAKITGASITLSTKVVDLGATLTDSSIISSGARIKIAKEATETTNAWGDKVVSQDYVWKYVDSIADPANTEITLVDIDGLDSTYEDAGSTLEVTVEIDASYNKPGGGSPEYNVNYRNEINGTRHVASCPDCGRVFEDVLFTSWKSEFHNYSETPERGLASKSNPLTLS